MEYKICRKCKKQKEINDFRKSGKYYRTECKICEKEYNKEYQKKYHKEYYKKNIEKIKEYRKNRTEINKQYMKKYYEEHKDTPEYKEKRKKYNETYIRPQESIDKHLEKTKQWRKNNINYVKEYRKKYREEHKEEIQLKNKEWRKNNKDKIKKIQQKDYVKRRNEPLLQFKDTIRNRIGESFRKYGYVKSKKTEKILGCNINDFINYLIQTYEDNYNEKWEWEYLSKVHIDHIIPLATAKSEDDVIKLCHYTNLQLLKANDNLSKGSKLDWNLTE